jgi:hypothetical protein
VSDFTETRKMKLPKLLRDQQSAMDYNAENRTMSFPFSSEMPVERWFGDEILAHDAGCADMARLNDGAPLLWNHDPNQMIGVVESATIGNDRRGYTTVRFGTSAMAEQILSDVQAGIIRNVSFGYRINAMTETVREGQSTYTATEWTPFEISLVAIPADPGVGLGRSLDDNESREVAIFTRDEAPKPKKELKIMSEAPAAPVVDVNAARAEAVSAERARAEGIRVLGEKFGKADLSRQLIESGRSLEDARGAFLEVLGFRQAPIDQSGGVDLSASEQRDYSVIRAINASMTGDWSKAGLERAASVELARQMGKETSGFFMPTNLQMDTRAAYAVGSGSTGGNLVATNLLASSFIEVLRNNAQIMNMGPTVLNGLVGNVAIPRQATATATYWVSEATAVTEAEATFDQVTLSPKQIGARSQYSRLALQQTTPDIEAIVRNDLAKVLALGMDLAAINGSGSSGQPKGILNTSGIGSVAMGTNGAALVNAAATGTTGFDQLIQLERAVDIANALNGNLYYLTNAKVVSALKQLKTAYADYLWSDNTDNRAMGAPGMVNGYAVARSNQVPSNLTKGTGTALSALLYGDFSQLVIGMWGGLEILPNPYGTGYTAGSVDIRALQTCDITVRHAESFAAITDIIA